MTTIRNTLLFVWEVLKIVLIALLIVIPIRYFVFQPFLVRGQSMEPNFHNSDYLIVDELSFRFIEPKRGEVIVFKYPNNPSQRYIKRIIGLPEETIEVKDKMVTVCQLDKCQVLDELDYLPESVKTPGDIKISLDENEYFVLGDNRTASSDSRKWGALPKENIVGRVIFRPWPINALAKIEIPTY